MRDEIRSVRFTASEAAAIALAAERDGLTVSGFLRRTALDACRGAAEAPAITSSVWPYADVIWGPGSERYAA